MIVEEIKLIHCVITVVSYQCGDVCSTLTITSFEHFWDTHPPTHSKCISESDSWQPRSRVAGIQYISIGFLPLFLSVRVSQSMIIPFLDS